jgi:hypothetical protein
MAATLRCWAAKPVRPFNSAWERDEGCRNEVVFCQSAKTLLDWAAGSPM